MHWRTATITRSTINGNIVSNGGYGTNGGGISNYGTRTITDITISGNTVE